MFVFDDHAGRQVFSALVNRATSQRERRVALEIIVSPDSWTAALPDSPRLAAGDG